MPSDPIYDVFLSHSSRDKPAVEELASKLSAAGLKPFLDKWHLIPGEPWQEGLEQALEQSRTCAVFLGPGDIGAWQNEEMRDALDERVRDGSYRVIPVLLPGSSMPEKKALPRFLRRLTWVDFRSEGLGGEDAFHRLKCGINGKPPGQGVTSARRQAPKYSSDRTRDLSERLKAARTELKERTRLKQPTDETRRKIRDLQGQIREGGQLEAGESLCDGRYELLEEIGQGGFANVWRAWDEERDEQVAIKMLQGRHVKDRSRVERFNRGALQMGRLSHDNIVRVIGEPQEDQGYRFFVMEYLEGGDFRDAVKEGRLTRDERLGVIRSIGEALQYAHRRGVIHRDVKPANILLDGQGRAKLTDFDLVRAGDTSGGTRTGMLGTVLYAAPEMLHRPQDADPRVDVYGLGMTAIFALHGQDLPLDVFRDAEGFLKEIGVSSELEGVISKAVAWKAEDRWPLVQEFCEVLRPVEKVPQRKLHEDRNLAPKPEGNLVVGRELSFAWSDFDTLGSVFVPGAARNPKPRAISLAAAQQAIKAGEKLKASGDKPTEEQLGELVEVMQSRDLPVSERLEAGLLAADLGDLPKDLDDFVAFEETPFGYPLWVAKYPVTNAQYQRFVDAGGYDREAGWISEAGQKKMMSRLGRWPDGPRRTNNSHFNRPTQPVAAISWYEAEAYCKWWTTWLREQGKIDEEQVVRLLKEEERKWVAGGSEGRKYPWGEGAEVDRLNCRESGLRRMSPVHMYPDGATPEGVWDLSGNVWEWTSTKKEDSISTYAIGGGVWYMKISLNSSAARNWYNALIGWVEGVGFRVSASPLLL